MTHDDVQELILRSSEKHTSQERPNLKTGKKWIDRRGPKESKCGNNGASRIKPNDTNG